MDGPSERIRLEVAGALTDIDAARPGARTVDEATETQLEGILAKITDALDDDLRREDPDGQPVELLAKVDAWAGLVSYAVGRVYGPGSPGPGGMAGWSHRIATWLRGIGCELTLKMMTKAATELGPDSIFVSAGFPWGISIGLSWDYPGSASEKRRERERLLREGRAALARLRRGLP